MSKNGVTNGANAIPLLSGDLSGACTDQIAELAEQVIAVMWTGRGLGMVLHTESGILAVPNPLDGLIVQVDVRDFYVARWE